MFFFVFWHFSTYEKYSAYRIGFSCHGKFSSVGSCSYYRELELLASRSLSCYHLLDFKCISLIWNDEWLSETGQDKCCFADNSFCIHHFCNQISGIQLFQFSSIQILDRNPCFNRKAEMGLDC